MYGQGEECYVNIGEGFCETLGIIQISYPFLSIKSKTRNKKMYQLDFPDQNGSIKIGFEML